MCKVNAAPVVLTLFGSSSFFFSFPRTIVDAVAWHSLEAEQACLPQLDVMHPPLPVLPPFFQSALHLFRVGCFSSHDIVQ